MATFDGVTAAAAGSVESAEFEIKVQTKQCAALEGDGYFDCCSSMTSEEFEIKMQTKLSAGFEGTFGLIVVRR